MNYEKESLEAIFKEIDFFMEIDRIDRETVNKLNEVVKEYYGWDKKG